MLAGFAPVEVNGGKRFLLRAAHGGRRFASTRQLTHVRPSSDEPETFSYALNTPPYNYGAPDPLDLPRDSELAKKLIPFRW